MPPAKMWLVEPHINSRFAPPVFSGIVLTCSVARTQSEIDVCSDA